MGEEREEPDDPLVNYNQFLDVTQELAPHYDPFPTLINTPSHVTQRAPHLVEHVSQIIFGIHPGSHCITEEDEVLKKHRGKCEKVRKVKGFKDQPLKISHGSFHALQSDKQIEKAIT